MIALLTPDELRAKHRAIPESERRIAGRFRISAPFADAVPRSLGLRQCSARPDITGVDCLSSEPAAVSLIESLRWRSKRICPHCAAADVVQMRAADGSRSARFLWRCRSCARQYTVKTGSAMEGSKVPVRSWLRAIFLACRPDGTTATEVMRNTGVTYKIALQLLRTLTDECFIKSDAPADA